MNGKRLTVLALGLVGLLVACGGNDAQDDESAASGDALSFGAFTAIAGPCPSSWDSILEGVSGGRRKVIERAKKWHDAHVGYSKSSYYANPGESTQYRKDCSGLVSMAWQRGTGLTTADFMDDAESGTDSVDDLQPGDAAVRRSGDDGHIFIFLQSTALGACTIEEEPLVGTITGLRPFWSMKLDGFRRVPY